MAKEPSKEVSRRDMFKVAAGGAALMFVPTAVWALDYETEPWVHYQSWGFNEVRPDKNTVTGTILYKDYIKDIKPFFEKMGYKLAHIMMEE